MVEGENRSKMVYSFWIMNSKNNKQDRVSMSPRVYETIRKEYSNLVRQKRLGKQTPEYVKEKIRQSLKGVVFDYMKKPKSELWYKRHAETHKGKSKKER